MALSDKVDSIPHATMVKAHVELGGQTDDNILDNGSKTFAQALYWAMKSGWHELAEIATRVVNHQKVNAEYLEGGASYDELFKLVPELLHTKAFMRIAVDNAPSDITPPDWFIKKHDGIEVLTDLEYSYSVIVGHYDAIIKAATDPFTP